MNFVIRNVLFVHLLALVAAFSWVHGGTRPDLLMPIIPWLTLMVLNLLMILPQAKSTETLGEARLRVWRALVRDPLLYVGLVLVIYLCIPLFNSTGEPEFNAVEKIWRIMPAPVKGLPFCVKPTEHAVLLLWFPPALVAALAAKHGLLKKGQRMLFEGACWNGALLAVVGLLQLGFGAKSVYWGEENFSYFFSTFGYPNFAGAFFTLLYALSAGLWINKALGESFGPLTPQSVFDKPNLLQKHYISVAVLLNLAGAIGSLSRAALLLSLLVTLALGSYVILGMWQQVGRGGRTKVAVSAIAVILLAIMYFYVFAPAALQAEMADISVEKIAERISSKDNFLPMKAKEIFQDYKVFGVGGWGFPHYLNVYTKPEERKRMQIVGGANVHNDSLQFLAENGIVGYTLIVLCGLLIAINPIRNGTKMVIKLRKAGLDKKLVKPKWVYLLPAVVIGVYVGTTAIIGHSLGDLPFRCPAVLIVWVLAFVCTNGFIPVVRHR